MHGVPFVQTRDIGRPLVVGSLDRTSSKIAAAYRRSSLNAGDLLVSLRGDIGVSTIVPPALEGANISRGVARVRPADRHDPHFIHYALQAPRVKRSISAASRGSTLREISIGSLRDVCVPVPPLAEQRRIAQILRTWDDAIERVESEHRQLLQRRTGLVQELIFGRGWPRGVIWHQTASGWDIRPIEEVASDVSSRNAGLTATDVLTCSKHRGFVRSADYFARSVHSADLSNYKVIRRGQFGFPSNHIEEGSIGLQNVVDVGAVSPIYTVFEFDQSLIDGDFAYLVLKTRAYTHMFDVSTSSSVDRRGSLRWPEFSKLPFPVPPLEEQRRIAGIASDAAREIQLLQRKAELLRTQKRGLMQKLLTGQVRVDVAAEVEPGGQADD